MKQFTTLLLATAIAALPAAADSFLYRVSGTVDLTAVDARDLKALRVTGGGGAPFAIEMTLEASAPDIDVNPSRGAYRVSETRISFSGNRQVDPEKSVRHITRAGRNMLFEVFDTPTFDGFVWNYAPQRGDNFAAADRIKAALTFDTATFTSDALPTRNPSGAQLLQASLAPPVVTISMANGNTYTMIMADAELVAEAQ